MYTCLLWLPFIIKGNTCSFLLEHHKSKRSNGFRPLYVWSGHGTRFVLGFECWEMACPSHMPPGLPIYPDPTGKFQTDVGRELLNVGTRANRSAQFYSKLVTEPAG